MELALEESSEADEPRLKSENEKRDESDEIERVDTVVIVQVRAK